jgi:IS30 family transposase
MNNPHAQYHRFSSDERVELYRLHIEGKSERQIASALNRSKSTIGREFKRCPKGQYCPIRAQRQAERRLRKEKGGRLTRDVEGCLLICSRLRRGWTPEQISGWLRRTAHAFQISTAAIYRFIRSRIGVKLGLHRLLPRHWKRRGRKDGRSAGLSTIPGRISISERPHGADDRSEFGHWEADTVLGARGTGAILTLVERRSRRLVARKLPSTKADVVGDCLKEIVESSPGCFLSITFDNGGEFAQHASLHAFGVDTYFADPHCAWQRGSNENTNGLLRRFVPKGSDLRLFEPQEIVFFGEVLNDRPRKCLEYATPNEIFAMLIETGEVAR